MPDGMIFRIHSGTGSRPTTAATTGKPLLRNPLARLIDTSHPSEVWESVGRFNLEKSPENIKPFGDFLTLDVLSSNPHEFKQNDHRCSIFLDEWNTRLRSAAAGKLNTEKGITLIDQSVFCSSFDASRKGLPPIDPAALEKSRS